MRVEIQKPRENRDFTARGALARRISTRLKSLISHPSIREASFLAGFRACPPRERLLDEVFSPNFAFHSHINPNGPLRGLEGARKMVTSSVFSDLQVTIEDIFAAGDKAAVRWTFRGT